MKTSNCERGRSQQSLWEAALWGQRAAGRRYGFPTGTHSRPLPAQEHASDLPRMSAEQVPQDAHVRSRPWAQRTKPESMGSRREKDRKQKHEPTSHWPLALKLTFQITWRNLMLRKWTDSTVRSQLTADEFEKVLEKKRREAPERSMRDSILKKEWAVMKPK